MLPSAKGDGGFDHLDLCYTVVLDAHDGLILNKLVNDITSRHIDKCIVYICHGE